MVTTPIHLQVKWPVSRSYVTWTEDSGFMSG